MTGGVLCVQLVNERLQLGFGDLDHRRLHQLGSLAKQPPRRAIPARELSGLCVVNNLMIIEIIHYRTV